MKSRGVAYCKTTEGPSELGLECLKNIINCSAILGYPIRQYSKVALKNEAFLDFPTRPSGIERSVQTVRAAARFSKVLFPVNLAFINNDIAFVASFRVPSGLTRLYWKRKPCIAYKRLQPASLSAFQILFFHVRRTCKQRAGPLGSDYPS